MTKTKKMATKEFRKLSKKEQKRRNALNRIPTCRGTITHGNTKYSKQDRHKKWDEYRDCLSA